MFSNTSSHAVSPTTPRPCRASRPRTTTSAAAASQSAPPSTPTPHRRRSLAGLGIYHVFFGPASHDLELEPAIADAGAPPAPRLPSRACFASRLGSPLLGSPASSSPDSPSPTRAHEHGLPLARGLGFDVPGWDWEVYIATPHRAAPGKRRCVGLGIHGVPFGPADDDGDFRPEDARDAQSIWPWVDPDATSPSELEVEVALALRTPPPAPRLPCATVFTAELWGSPTSYLDDTSALACDDGDASEAGNDSLDEDLDDGASSRSASLPPATPPALLALRSAVAVAAAGVGRGLGLGLGSPVRLSAPKSTAHDEDREDATTSTSFVFEDDDEEDSSFADAPSSPPGLRARAWDDVFGIANAFPHGLRAGGGRPRRSL